MKNLIKQLPLVIIFISFAISLYFYPHFPAVVASHWNINGQVDGYANKLVGLFILPIISLGLYFLFRFLPKTDPYKKNFPQFENHFNNFIVSIIALLFYLHILTLVWNLGFEFNMVQFFSPAFAGLFYFTGVMISNAKQNWFVGIRTPWTLSSEFVWAKTHILGGKLFKAVALISLLGIIFPPYAFFLLIIPLVSVSLFLFFYSYYLYGHYKK